MGITRDGKGKVDELREQLKFELKGKVYLVDCYIVVWCCYLGGAIYLVYTRTSDLRNVNVIKDDSLDVTCLEDNLLRVSHRVI